MQQMRIQLLKNMLTRFVTWDGKSETAVKLVTENQADIEDLQSLDLQLNTSYTKQEQELAEQIMEKQQNIWSVIKTEQQHVLHQMQQMKQKDKVIHHYYQNVKRSVFVDEGL